MQHHARHRRELAAVVLALLTAAAAVPSLAYAPLTTDGWDRFRWSTPEAIPWSLDADGGDLPRDVVLSAVRAALETWGAVPDQRLGFRAEPEDGGEANGRIHFEFEVDEWDPSVADAAALTTTFRKGSGAISKAVVAFNGVDMRWTVNGGDPYDVHVVDLQGVATHEVGHAVGLAHSRHREATMFFAGGSAGNRSLRDDDVRGLRYLYPVLEFTDGEPCDGCETDAHCTDGACLFFPDEGGFCGGTCAAADDCPWGYGCVALSGAGGQCLPASLHCAEMGSAIPDGQPCYGNTTCQSGLCLVVGDDARCVTPCAGEPGAPDACPAGARCVSYAGMRVCVVPGALPFGSPCHTHTDCEDALCAANSDGAVCVATCGAGATCPDGARCIGDLCVAPGQRPLGADCEGHLDCASALCVAVDDETFCAERCAETAPRCPEGAVCLAFQEASYCRAVGIQPEGRHCRTTAGCEAGLECQPGNVTGGWGVCVRPCDPLAESTCESAEVCAWAYGSAGAAEGRCVSADGALVDESCGPAYGPCRSDLVCLLGQDSAGSCRPHCAPDDTEACPAGATCRPLTDGVVAAPGVCASDTAATSQAWAPGVSATPAHPEVDPEQAAVILPIAIAPRPSSSGGCAMVSLTSNGGLDSPAGSVLPWVVLALAGCLRRASGRDLRRQREDTDA